LRSRALTARSGTVGPAAMEYTLLIAGALIIAASFNVFLNPNRIASGGVAGISTIVYSLAGVEPAMTQWFLNIPLFLAGWRLLGGQFSTKTAVGSLILPLFVLLTRHFPPLTENTLLAAIYGGIGIGLGLGIVFRGKGSTGGLDLLAQLIHRYTGLPLGLAVAVLDGSVILASGIAFNPEKALYALVGLFVTTKTIDIVQMGWQNSKIAFIITNRTEEVSRAVLHDLDRGLTKLEALGGYTGEERTLLMVVVNQNEVTRLKAAVKKIDPRAFMILSQANEVLGEGFRGSR